MRMILLFALVGCGPTPEQLREREICYAKAEAAAQERVDTECAVSFATCPKGAEILDQLRTAQESCP
jgi:hypothetical protein